MPVSNRCRYFCQTPGLVLRLGVDFVLPLSQQQEQEEEEEESSLKSFRRESTQSLKFSINTYLGSRGQGLRNKWGRDRDKR